MPCLEFTISNAADDTQAHVDSDSALKKVQRDVR
jgi:hypothetical protein